MREKVAEVAYDIVVITDTLGTETIQLRKTDEYGFLHHHLPPYNWELAEF